MFYTEGELSERIRTFLARKERTLPNIASPFRLRTLWRERFKQQAAIDPADIAYES